VQVQPTVHKLPRISAWVAPSRGASVKIVWGWAASHCLWQENCKLEEQRFFSRCDVFQFERSLLRPGTVVSSCPATALDWRNSKHFACERSCKARHVALQCHLMSLVTLQWNFTMASRRGHNFVHPFKSLADLKRYLLMARHWQPQQNCSKANHSSIMDWSHANAGSVDSKEASASNLTESHYANESNHSNWRTGALILQ